MCGSVYTYICMFACKLGLKITHQGAVSALDCFNNNSSRGVGASTVYTRIPTTSNNLFTICFSPQTAPKNKLRLVDKDPPAPNFGQTFGLFGSIWLPLSANGKYPLWFCWPCGFCTKVEYTAAKITKLYALNCKDYSWFI